MVIIRKKLNSREKELSLVSRFGRFPMNYPQDLNMHYFSVSALYKYLVQNSNSQIFDELDLKLGLTLCKIHDDDEILLDDFPSNMKMKLTQPQKEKLTQHEQKAAQILNSQYSDAMGENYYNNLIRAGNKQCLESQLLSYVDRLVGFSEMVHETLSGNFTLITQDSVHTNYQTLFQTLNPKLNHLIPFFNSKDELNFTLPNSLDNTIQTLEKIIRSNNSIKFNPTNILNNTNITIYEHYKKAILNSDNKQAINILCNQRIRTNLFTDEYYQTKLNNLISRK
jgi:5'-deoxynucleotidase YfbR-like HD superfamily hydrolase